SPALLNSSQIQRGFFIGHEVYNRTSIGGSERWVERVMGRIDSGRCRARRSRSWGSYASSRNGRRAAVPESIRQACHGKDDHEQGCQDGGEECTASFPHRGHSLLFQECPHTSLGVLPGLHTMPRCSCRCSTYCKGLLLLRNESGQLLPELLHRLVAVIGADAHCTPDHRCHLPGHGWRRHVCG